jgi:uncharacterized membrane protein (UPF0127 family)
MTDGDDRARRRVRLLRWSAGLLVVAAIIGFVAWGSNRPDNPHLKAPASGRTPVAGFGEIAYRVDPGGAAERCALLADTTAQHQLGLMHRTDLAGHDGMVFRFPADVTAEFYMKDTPLPLSIAWFDVGGSFVAAADMDPCLDQVRCPTYGPGAPYRYALEVPRGALPGLGIGAGSHLSLGGACR